MTHRNRDLPTPTAAQPQRADVLTEPTTTLRNFCLMALHQVLVRIGWIFKTESIVMPAFLDFIGGGPTLRGFLPLLNRFGFSVPPVLFARRLKLAPRKSRVAVLTTFTMALPFAALAVIWRLGVWQNAEGLPADWVPYLFLAFYGAFFCLTGVNQLAVHALQGKLISPHHRGRLFSVGVAVGAPLAIFAAWSLMPKWLDREDGGFGQVFSITACLFALAAAAMSFTHEAVDDYHEQQSSPWRRFHDAWSSITRNDNCRRLGLLAALFSISFTLFPHYQALGRSDARGDLQKLVEWVCIQNAATAFFGLVIGPVADRYGNRTALHLTVFGSALAPLAALWLTWSSLEVRDSAGWLMFVPLGFTPVSVRLLINYALEVADPADHPRFVSAVGVCLAAPVMLLSPLAGGLVAQTGFAPLYLLGLAALLAAGLQTFRLVEPRKGR